MMEYELPRISRLFTKNIFMLFSICTDDRNVVVEEPMDDDKTDEVAVECSALDCDTDSLGCEHGLKQDEAGCDTCACHICRKVRCLMRCEHGFATDERNCPACQCAERKGTWMTRALIIQMT